MRDRACVYTSDQTHPIELFSGSIRKVSPSFLTKNSETPIHFIRSDVTECPTDAILFARKRKPPAQFAVGRLRRFRRSRVSDHFHAAVLPVCPNDACEVEYQTMRTQTREIRLYGRVASLDRRKWPVARSFPLSFCGCVRSSP